MNKYRSYMDKIDVSPELHEKILQRLEEEPHPASVTAPKEKKTIFSSRFLKAGALLVPAAVLAAVLLWLPALDRGQSQPPSGGESVLPGDLSESFYVNDDGEIPAQCGSEVVQTEREHSFFSAFSDFVKKLFGGNAGSESAPQAPAQVIDGATNARKSEVEDPPAPARPSPASPTPAPWSSPAMPGGTAGGTEACVIQEPVEEPTPWVPLTPTNTAMVPVVTWEVPDRSDEIRDEELRGAKIRFEINGISYTFYMETGILSCGSRSVRLTPQDCAELMKRLGLQ